MRAYEFRSKHARSDGQKWGFRLVMGTCFPTRLTYDDDARALWTRNVYCK